jgi:hypothetical protein
MLPETLAGLLITLGSVVFILAALFPISRVFAERNPEVKLALVEDHLSTWRMAQFCFALGSALNVAGLAVLSSYLWTTQALITAWIALALVALGTFFWIWHVLLRAAEPEAFFLGEKNGWLFPAFSGLTLGALAAYGLTLLLAGYPTWLGLLLIGAGVIFAALYLVMKDLPPLFIYTITLIAGVALLL